MDSKPAEAVTSAAAEMLRKGSVYIRRNRRPITLLLYTGLLGLLCAAIYDPMIVDILFPFLRLSDLVQVGGDPTRSEISTTTTLRTPGVARVFDLPFVPRDYLCDEMHLKVSLQAI